MGLYQSIWLPSSPSRLNIVQTIRSFLSALKSVHIDNNWAPEIFENQRLRHIIKGAARLFPHLKKDRFPTTKDILFKITYRSISTKAQLNFNTAFIIAWAGFLRSGEFTYTTQDKEDPMFIQKNLTRSDITFQPPNHQYVIVRLKFSKTDYDHTGVEIILAATNDALCPVHALRELFRNDPQHLIAPLFNIDGGPLTRKVLVDHLRVRLNNAGISDVGFFGHSFRKGAAQHAADHGMLNEKIKRLGRWTSESFKLYFKDSEKTLLNLSYRFQKGAASRV